jgi:hypothetical protein
MKHQLYHHETHYDLFCLCAMHLDCSHSTNSLSSCIKVISRRVYLVYTLLFHTVCVMVHIQEKHMYKCTDIYVNSKAYFHTHKHRTCDILYPANRQSTEKHITYQLLYIYSTPPDDGLQKCLKYVGVD